MEGGEPLHVQALDPASGSVHVVMRLPEGYKFLPDGQHSVALSSSDEGVVYVPHFELPDLTFDWRVPIEVRGEGEAILYLQGMVFFCPVTDESICMFAACDQELRVQVDPDGGDVEIVHEIEPMG